MDLVKNIYDLTNLFPKEEIYGITSQMRRASVAIPTNITEGYYRHHRKEYVQFLYIAKSSACELETLLELSSNLGYGVKEKLNKAMDLTIQTIKMLTKLILSLKQL